MTRSDSPPSDRQRALYRYLVESTLANLYQPSLSEMADHMGVSVSAVHGHLKALARKGWIGASGSRSRAIEILRKPSVSFTWPEGFGP